MGARLMILTGERTYTDAYNSTNLFWLLGLDYATSCQYYIEDGCLTVAGSRWLLNTIERQIGFPKGPHKERIRSIIRKRKEEVQASDGITKATYELFLYTTQQEEDELVAHFYGKAKELMNILNEAIHDKELIQWDI